MQGQGQIENDAARDARRKKPSRHAGQPKQPKIGTDFICLLLAVRAIKANELSPNEERTYGKE